MQASQIQKPAHFGAMPAPLYKRWAPPKPVIKQSPSAVPTHDEVASVSKPASSPAPSVEASFAETTSPIKKPKKRKRDADGNGQDEEKSKKHKAIFSKFERVSRLAETRSQCEEEGLTNGAEKPPEETLHDLQPMPQPSPVPEPVFKSTFSTLPTWLAQPVAVDASKTLPFIEIGVDPFYIKKLEKQGFRDALAVQTALLPMLHPGLEQHLGDICVSARTGSGKTLAYLLPIIEALKDRVVPILSAIIVVPSRQLVNQALHVAEELCAGTKIKVGTALGNVAFAAEQRQLVRLREHYNPTESKQLQERISRQIRTGFVERESFFDDVRNMPLDHVPRYNSGVDILICTPGRLVEHIEHTTGFRLDDVRWLVIDEADQLLNENFQGWTDVLMDALYGETPVDFMNARERITRRERDAYSIWSMALPARRQVTKVVLSATMERDLTKLGTLKLRRPKLVIIQDETTKAQVLERDENVVELPSTLDEFAVHVGDGSNKPLHLLHVLNDYVFPGTQSCSKHESSSSSDTESSSGSSTSVARASMEQSASIANHTSRVLVFTKSNESASRLSHLISVLQPAFKKHLQTMTRALTADASRKLLKSFSTGAIKVLIASDAASRGLDVPSITHVINYDMPTSVTSYVHRVGRTARAGNAGEAWTLFTKSEAAWFLKQVTKGSNIKRGNRRVKRAEWKESAVTADGRKRAYRTALKQLESAVTGNTKSG